MTSRLITVALILFLVDLYCYQAFKTAFGGDGRVMKIYWTFSGMVVLTLMAGLFSDFSAWPKVIRIYWVAFIFIVYLSKLFVLPFLAVDDILRGVKWVAGLFPGKSSSGAPEYSLTRSEFLSKAALIVALVPFGLFLKGMITGISDFSVRRVRVGLRNLPPAFEGLKIVQISDMHTGTFVSSSPLEKAVNIIRDLKPDVVFFTGDLVNNLASEAEGFVEILREIQAPMGVYSILGNHDYGDYHRFPSAEEKLANFEAVKNVHRQAGWKLLLNEHTELERSGEKISLIGLENWGTRGFQQYGNMRKAMTGMPDNPVTILLSHDPSHWSAQVNKKFPSVDLTLSGHTHGMQFGIEIKGFRWSPSKYFYEHWAGLYSKGSQYLYVNRGLGCIGYPGRVGILPEITLLELHRS
jgi:uncharacterized protein